LLGAFFAAVELFAPLFFVMENVPSVLYQLELGEPHTEGGCVRSTRAGLARARARSMTTPHCLRQPAAL